MKKLILYTFCFLLVGAATAQQVEEFSLEQDNAFALNPALAGMNGYLHGFATFRKQFLRIKQSPYTALVAMDGQIADKHIGIGGYIIQDVTGPTQKTGGTVAFAYNLPLSKKYNRYSNGQVDHILSFGASVSFVQYRLQASQLLLDNPGDPALYTSNGFKFFPDASFGIYYKWKENFYAGVSVPQILGLNINYRGNDGLAEIKTVQHLNFLAGGRISWFRGNYSIDPVAGFRWVKGAPPQGDFGLRFWMYKVVWIGGMYKSTMYVVPSVGCKIKDLVTVAYACDVNVAKYRADIGTTHEITVGFSLGHRSRVWRGTGPALRF